MYDDVTTESGLSRKLIRENHMENGLFPRWISKTLGILLIVLVFVTIIYQLKSISGTPQTMNISAQGKISSVPDLATVSIGVVSEGTDAVDVKNKIIKK